MRNTVSLIASYCLKCSWPKKAKRLPTPVHTKTEINWDKLSPVLVSSKRTSTLEYYFCSRFPQSEVILTSSVKPDILLIPKERDLIIVRGISLPWLRLIRKNANYFKSISFFVDDDLPSITDDTSLPPGYVFIRATHYLCNLSYLNNICHNIWVSTNTLAQKYQVAHSIVIPVPLIPYPNHTRVLLNYYPQKKTVFYHGSLVHKEEISWLYQVIKAVVEKHPNIRFEIFGNRTIRHLYSDIPQADVLNPMSWQDFRYHGENVQYDIGLAPLLDSPFNSCRSHVKYFDITRAGAIGLYAKDTIYDEIIDHGENGYLLPMSKDIWVAKIAELLEQ